MKNSVSKLEPEKIKKISLLFVEDDTDVHSRILEFLQIHFDNIFAAFNGKDGLTLFEKHQPDVVLTDIKMPVMDGLEMAQRIKKLKPETPLIINSAFTDTEIMIKAIEIGIDHYVTKPTKIQKLMDALHKSILPLIQKKEIDSLNKKILYNLESRIGKSHSLKDVIAGVHKVAKSDFSVILHGETGGGKSHIARIIHELSERADKPFITVDIGAIPETLLESELFGHKKGSYTGASSDKKGFFEIAGGGTLFIEDMENLSAYAQVKILRAVEEKQVFPIGSTTPVEANIRIISASNKNLFDEVKKNNFREDLFYRLCEFDIKIPPLRERVEDIPFLAEKFIIEVAGELNRNIKEITSEAMEILEKYRWNGNVRELKNVMRRAFLTCEEKMITKNDFLELLTLTGKKETQSDTAPIEPTLASAVKYAEKKAIIRALEKTAWKKVKAAALLEIDYKTLASKIKKYNIEN